MSERPVAVLIEDILEALAKARRYVQGMDEAAFSADDRTVDAVVRNLEIIGEASGRLPDGFRQEHPGIPWSQMIGLRNRVVHEYFGVDKAIVWTILSDDLPALETNLRALRNVERRGDT